MKHVVVSCGGNLGSWSLPRIEEGTIRIGVDRGALFLANNGYSIQYALGDFDSVSAEELEVIKKHAVNFEAVDAVDKNDTDSGLAIEKAISLSPDLITIIGGTGNRYDHVINNFQLLIKTDRAEIPCIIEDANNRIQLVSEKNQLILYKSDYKYVSLIPLSNEVNGITLKGFKYSLSNAQFILGSGYGVSNELIEAEATVTVSAGYLLVIESKD